MILETNRLIIRPTETSDRHELFAYRSDAETNKYQGWIPKTLGEVDFFLTRLAKEVNQPVSWYQYILIEKESQQIIGDLGVHFLDEANTQCELGCTLRKASQNQGYATEALRRVVDFLFNDLNKHRITVSIDPANTASIRLIERLGFRKEAHMIESLYFNGKWVDDLIYALLKREWKGY